MLSSRVKELHAALSVLRQCIVASDCACALANNASAPVFGDEIKKRGAGIPARRDWLIFNHCASLTRLYAIFSGFVEGALEEWLRELPKLYERYSSLPEVLRYEHKAGVARLLPKVGEGRFKHLTAENILRGIYFGVSIESGYDLPVEAYLIQDRNLKTEVLCDLFRRVGLSQLREWIRAHSDLQAFMNQAYGDQQTAEAQLDTLVDYRNEAAHGLDVAEVLSEQEQVKLAEFVSVLGAVLVEFIEFTYWQLRCEGKTAVLVGSVTEYFKEPDAFIAKVAKARIEVGQVLVALEKERCRRVTVLSLQDNGKPVEAFDAVGEAEAGIKFDVKLNIGARLLDPKPAPNDNGCLGAGI
jgi:hypothetical protein